MLRRFRPARPQECDGAHSRLNHGAHQGQNWLLRWGDLMSMDSDKVWRSVSASSFAQSAHAMTFLC